MKPKSDDKKSKGKEWDSREKFLERSSRALSPSNEGGHEDQIISTKQERKFNPRKKFRGMFLSFGIFMFSALFLVLTMYYASILFLWFLAFVDTDISGAIFCINYARYLVMWVVNLLTQHPLK